MMLPAEDLVHYAVVLSLSTSTIRKDTKPTGKGNAQPLDSCRESSFLSPSAKTYRTFLTTS